MVGYTAGPKQNPTYEGNIKYAKKIYRYQAINQICPGLDFFLSRGGTLVKIYECDWQISLCKEHVVGTCNSLSAR